MRGDIHHLKLVRQVEADVSATVLAVPDGGNMISVHFDNVREGQVCEVLHAGMFALSPRVVVPEGRTSVTIATFALNKGSYDVSVRIDGVVDPATDAQPVLIGARREKSKAALPSTRPAPRNARPGITGPRTRPYALA